MNLYFVIPVFNESINLDLLSDNLKNSLPLENKFYLFIDDCSSDESVAKIHGLFRDCKYHIITKDKNLGPGDSFNRGFEWVLNKSDDPSDIVITMEADNTSDISLLPHMLSISRLGYSLVLASVYVQGGAIQRSSVLRRVISFAANMFLRFVFKVKVQTLSSFYRIYTVSLLRRIKSLFNTIISEKGFVCMFEILLKAIKSEASIIEVPMLLRSDNRKDRSKMKILKTMNQYMKYTVKLLVTGVDNQGNNNPQQK